METSNLEHGLYLNLGSGQRPFLPPWLNVDCQAKWQPDILADIRNVPLPDQCARLIMLHHVLEHFDAADAKQVLTECKRLLEPGGRLVVIVPDIVALAREFLRGRIDTDTYLVNTYGAYTGHEADRHKWGYSRVTLGNLLLETFQVEPAWYHFRPIEGANVAAPDWWFFGLEVTLPEAAPDRPENDRPHSLQPPPREVLERAAVKIQDWSKT